VCLVVKDELSKNRQQFNNFCAEIKKEFIFAIKILKNE